MSREIKFRAWNGKEMRYNVNINDGKPVRKGYQWFNESNDVHDSCPMQFTGLKDKNGKEIYEGDILKCNELQGTVLFGEIDGMIGWHIDLGCMDYPIGSEVNLLGQNKSIEVIGNIYENPELITPTNKQK